MVPEINVAPKATRISAASSCIQSDAEQGYSFADQLWREKVRQRRKDFPEHETGAMNLALIDPFVLQQDYPESTTGSLRSGHSVCVRFNRKGDLLASGRVDGTVVIFDVETNGVACKLKGHTRQIQSLSWSRNGRYLLSSSVDWTCKLWDLQDGSILREVRFEAPVYIAVLHPFNQ